MRTAQRVFAAALAAALLALPVTIFALDDAAAAKTAQKRVQTRARTRVWRRRRRSSPDVTTQGEVTAGGQHIAYNAIAGTITVGRPTRRMRNWVGRKAATGQPTVAGRAQGSEGCGPTARMFYVAYFKKDAKAEERPITFFYNGGRGVRPCGCIWARWDQARGDGHGYALRRRLTDGGQRQFLAGCERPGVHRHAGDGFGRLLGKEPEKHSGNR